MSKQLWVPFLGKLLAWWQVAVCALARVVKIHRDERKEVGVIKLLIAHAKPLPQKAAAGIIPRHSRLLSNAARRLANNDDARAGRGAIDRQPTLRRKISVHWVGTNVLVEEWL